MWKSSCRQFVCYTSKHSNTNVTVSAVTGVQSGCWPRLFQSRRAPSTLIDGQAASTGRQLHHRCRLYSSTTATARSLRRKRVVYEKFSLDDHFQSDGLSSVDSSSSLLSEPVPLRGDGDSLSSSLDDYTNKASLSPWVPVPDSVARKIFDTATQIDNMFNNNNNNSTAGEIVHVELGCGDGRVCFAAVLDYGVVITESVGVDVDENIIEVALERKRKIHPPPPIQFIVADLLSSPRQQSLSSSSSNQSDVQKDDVSGDAKDPEMSTPIDVWRDHVERASIVTMYFEKSGLEKIRRRLELSLMRNPNTLIKIFCCGYAMPGWESTMVETVLDMPIYYYEWRGGRVGSSGGGGTGVAATTTDIPLTADSFIDQYNLSSSLPNKSRGGVAGLYEQNDNAGTSTMDPFLQKKKNSDYRPDPLPGYHPDDLVDYGWDDFSDWNEADDDSGGNNKPNKS